MHVKGVNLGNWLVLEKWMSPALFEGTDAEDEYYLPRRLSKEVYEARIKIHRAEYISERDFATIKAMGMEAVRIPVPYFIFGDREPFIGCVEELDKAFNRVKLKLLADKAAELSNSAHTHRIEMPDLDSDEFKREIDAMNNYEKSEE